MLIKSSQLFPLRYEIGKKQDVQFVPKYFASQIAYCGVWKENVVEAAFK